MIRLLLLCSLGISTLSFQKELNLQAQKAGIELTVDSASVESLAALRKDYDMVLLAPQVRFNLKKVVEFYDNVPVMAIDPESFAVLDVSKILAQLKKL